jgi:hypothetical protein
MSSSSSSSHNLNVRAYSLEELLALFEIASYDITLEDMRKAKKKMLMTHPDQSRLPSTYFLFYRQAYEVILTFYQEQHKQKQSTDNVGDYEAPEVDHSINMQQTLEKMSARDFQSRFNQLFDQMDMGSKKPDPQRNAWFTHGDPVVSNVPDRISTKDMAQAFQTIKHKNRDKALIQYQGVQDMMIQQGATSLYDEDGDGDGGSGGNYISSDVFSKLKFDDLRKVHKDQTVLTVSETDYEKMPKYKSVDQYAQHRDASATTPLAEHEAQRLLQEQARTHREKVMQREYQALLRVQENEKKNKTVLSQFLLLKASSPTNR